MSSFRGSKCLLGIEGPYLANLDDLTLAVSDLVLPLHVIPELALRLDLVWRKDSDSEELGLWILSAR